MDGARATSVAEMGNCAPRRSKAKVFSAPLNAILEIGASPEAFSLFGRKEVIGIAIVDLGWMSYDRAIRVFSHKLLRVVADKLSAGMKPQTILSEVEPLLKKIDACDAMLR